MVDTAKIRAAVIEKHEVVLNQLAQLPYDDVIKLIASLSFIIDNLDRAQEDGEFECNKIIVSEMGKDPGVTFFRAEAILETSEAYLSYKSTMSLKQLAVRDLNIARLHMQYLLKSRMEGDGESEVGEG